MGFLGYTFVGVLLMTAIAAGKNATLDDCPANLERNVYLQVYGDHCYEFYLTGKKEWTDARDVCGDDGGLLVMPKTAEIQNFIYQELLTTYDYGNKVWIGLDDRDDEEHFFWADGSELLSTDYSDWAKDQGPENDDDPEHYFEDCVAIKMSDNGKWHDYTCDSTAFDDRHYAFVCQFQV